MATAHSSLSLVPPKHVAVTSVPLKKKKKIP